MKKTIKIIISLVLCVTCIVQPCAAGAATFTGKAYVKEMIISYGKTEDDAKSWLESKGYKTVNYNLNEGADDTFSTKRSVYLGYKTTYNADEAITDMKLMNMKGGYSIEDYQMLLNEQKNNIGVFIENFKVALEEYRDNYKNGQERAVAAHEMLNLLYDDDTEEALGDLLLEKIKEEYSDEEWNALSKDAQSKAADMTTILMQANTSSVLAIEQLISLATDDSTSVWSDRYTTAKTYDEMVSELIKSEKLTVTQAVKKLAAEYDSDASAIASKLEGYADFLKTYTDEELRLSDSAEKLEAYQNSHKDFNVAGWASAGAQYEVLNSLKNDDVTLYELLMSGDYDIESEDRCMLYPLVSVLTDGQRACLDFLSMNQIVAIGINDDASIKKAMESIDIKELNKDTISVYYGIDRTIFSSEVALTGDAYRLQSSTDKDASGNWFNGGISPTTKIILISLGVATVASVASLIAGFSFGNAALKSAQTLASIESKAAPFVNNVLEGVADDVNEIIVEQAEDSISEYADDVYDLIDDADEIFGAQAKATANIASKTMWSKIFNYAGIAMTAVTFILLSYSAWRTYQELKEYYNVDFTPIPMHMVNQGVDENNEKVFTYYTAVKCNREEAQLVTEETKVLKGFGDLNGDVGKQWVALYTSKDKAAGDPITANFVVQYVNSSIPDDTTALSMFCENTAQNLTNKKSGFTYADGKNGIYLFYGTDSSVFAGSVYSNGTHAIFCGGAMIVCGFVSYFIIKGIRKKKNGKEAKVYA